MPGGGGGGEVYPVDTGVHPFRLAAARQSTFPIKGKDNRRFIPTPNRLA